MQHEPTFFAVASKEGQLGTIESVRMGTVQEKMLFLGGPRFSHAALLTHLSVEEPDKYTTKDRGYYLRMIDDQEWRANGGPPHFGMGEGDAGPATTSAAPTALLMVPTSPSTAPPGSPRVQAPPAAAPARPPAAAPTSLLVPPRDRTSLLRPGSEPESQPPGSGRHARAPRAASAEGAQDPQASTPRQRSAPEPSARSPVSRAPAGGDDATRGRGAGAPDPDAEHDLDAPVSGAKRRATVIIGTIAALAVLSVMVVWLVKGGGPSQADPVQAVGRDGEASPPAAEQGAATVAAGSALGVGVAADPDTGAPAPPPVLDCQRPGSKKHGLGRPDQLTLTKSGSRYTASVSGSQEWCLLAACAKGAQAETWQEADPSSWAGAFATVSKQRVAAGIVVELSEPTPCNSREGEKAFFWAWNLTAAYVCDPGKEGEWCAGKSRAQSPPPPHNLDAGRSGNQDVGVPDNGGSSQQPPTAVGQPDTGTATPVTSPTPPDDCPELKDCRSECHLNTPGDNPVTCVRNCNDRFKCSR
jgi:hypothetical protein